MCGFPTAAAKQLIAELEPFDRGVFGGIVGWSDADGNGEWAVVIRCGIVEHTRVRLFAGAGKTLVGLAILMLTPSGAVSGVWLWWFHSSQVYSIESS